MTSSKSSWPKRPMSALFLRLPSFRDSNKEIRAADGGVEAPGCDEGEKGREGQEGIPSTAEDSELETPHSEPSTEAGVTVQAAEYTASPSDPSAPALPPSTSSRDKKAQWRKSSWALLSSYLPSLTSPSSPDADLPHRKPLPGAPSEDSPTLGEFGRLPVYDSPQDDRMSAGFSPVGSTPTSAGHARSSSRLDADLPPPPPLKEPRQLSESHSRKPSIPNMLKKIQKVAAVPALHHPSPPQQQLPPLPPLPPKVDGRSHGSREPVPLHRGRSNSFHQVPPAAGLQPGQPRPSMLDVSAEPRVRSTSAQPPRVRDSPIDSPRVVSSPVGSRPGTSGGGDGGSSGHSGGRLRKAFGKGSKGSKDLRNGQPQAWLLAPDSHADYNLLPLLKGEKVPEIWNESGAVYVFLFPKNSGRGPSFKVPLHHISSSRILNGLVQQDLAARGGSTHQSPNELHLYLPFAPGVLSPSLEVVDLPRVLSVRNLFAFLAGQPLVGVKACASVFAVFIQMSRVLEEFEFISPNGSSFVEVIDNSFRYYINHLAIGDMRHSREKTLEGLILGERMRSWPLYNEAFVHAVGKYDGILELKSPLFDSINQTTRLRLERAHFDLLNRESNVNTRLETFEFPSLFAGVANSTSTEEYRQVRFKNWKVSFAKMRSFLLGYYKDAFGAWPPKARSKKNPFTQSGLNRQVLKILYSDLCALYDLLVDRESLTPRVIDQNPEDGGDSETNHPDPMISALRQMLSEFDRSSPPVLPPVPYDVPKIPSMTTIRENYHELDAKTQARLDRGIQSHELLLILVKSHNIDTDGLRLPFLTAFKDFEHREAKGATPPDLADQRIGHWLFLYVVIQSLPMLVVDAPDLQHTDGVEYFLCEPPLGNPPWVAEDAGEVRKVWYEVSGGASIVELSADVVMHSVEGTYHRSHCWLAAKEWEAASSGGGNAAAAGSSSAALSSPPPSLALQTGAPPMSPLAPPRAAFQDFDPSGAGSRPNSAGGSGTPPTGSPVQLPVRGRNSSPTGGPYVPGGTYRSSVLIGLEPLSPPQYPASGSGSRPGSRGSSAGPSLTVRPDGTSRSPSVGNIHTNYQQQQPQQRMASPARSTPVSAAAGSATPSSGGASSTFDDILKGMEQDPGKSKKRFGF